MKGLNKEQSIVPFLKWAGGKRWLTKSNPELFPHSFKTYYEPFLGSAAVYCHLSPTAAVLADTNKDLINTYIAIKRNHKLVYKHLTEHQIMHCKDYYYAIRSSKPRSIYQRAAKFTYLNRTCWNGLYRVNLKGEFNVPIGTKTSVLLENDDFQALARKLSKCKLLVSDFRDTINLASAGDFIFADPPYTVKHNVNGFIKYNESIFSWEDQIALLESLIFASKRGVKILLTNANHKSIRNLYHKHFDVNVLNRASVIAASSSFRSDTTELVIKNY